MNINSIRYCIRQSCLSLVRNFWLAVVTAGIIAVSLAILGGFMLVAINAGQIMRSIESNAEISVFLYDGADLPAIRDRLSKLEGVHSYIFVPKEEGLADFSRAMGDRVPLNGLEGEDNPLPDMLRVRAQRAELVPALAVEIQAYPGVELADYGEALVEGLARATRWLNTISVILSSMLGLGAVFLIITSIRLSVLARQEELGVMKYLGASNWFIRFPFLLEGMVVGWVGTLVAVVVLGLVYSRAAIYLQKETLAFFLQPVTEPSKLLPLFAGLLVMGTLIGGIGSLASIRKFLRA